jgi:hypothetical protein
VDVCEEEEWMEDNKKERKKIERKKKKVKNANAMDRKLCLLVRIHYGNPKAYE